MVRFVEFPSTFWTTLLASPDRARQELFARYRAPIYNFVLNRGFREHDAEDLTQEVFLRISREGFLRKADRTKGKFRTLLLAVTRHVIQKERQRRSARQAPPLGPAAGALEGGPPAEASEEELFTTLWVKNLVELALQRLQADTAPGGPRYYEALVLSKFRGLSYEAIARELGVGVGDVKNWIHYGKKKVRRYLVDEIRSTCAGEREFEADVALLRPFLR